ncbi:hypothetical protein BDP27DRAFT_1414047 [Rhodocollybia butyracea]|uniref:Uncharacterized protein n=1 Tax=Rhodocollybia butyracea TaxID=206335 RepID=A0A9P5Q918_9AGAR|nr:hypothetical protein BDP27DRAFT_1414047 [Rhodocollybia butyracea]
MSTLPSAKGSVTEPISKEKKDQDVERKLNLYSTLNAFRESKLPENKQIDSWFGVLQKNLGTEGHSQKLSSQGQKLTADLREILDTLRLFLSEKNGDEMIQDFIWNTRDVDPVDLKNDEPKKEGHVWVLRRTKLEPTRSKSMKRIEAKVSSFMWCLFRCIPQERAREQESKGADGMIKDRVQDRVQERVPSETQEQVNAAAKDAIATADAGISTTQSAAQSSSKDARGQEVSPVSEGAEEVKEEAKKRGLMDRFKNAIPSEHQDKAKDHLKRGKEFITEEYFPKGRRDQWIWRMKKVILECQSHPEYQDSLRWLLKYIKEYAGHGRKIANEHHSKVTEGVKGNADLQGSMSQLRAITERFANDKEFKEWWEQVGDYVEKVLLTPGYVIEPSCNNRGRELLDSGKKFYGSGELDEGAGEPSLDSPAASTSFQPSLDSPAAPTSFQPSLDKPAASSSLQNRAVVAGGNHETAPVISPSSAAGLAPGGDVTSSVAASKRPILTTETAVRGKYREHFDHVFEGFGTFVGGMGQDPLNHRLGTDIQRLAKDLLFDAEGKLAFKSELWEDVRNVIMPGLIDKVGLIPIPRIEYTDDSLDLVVENLTLSAKNLFPNLVEVEVKNFVRFGSGTVTGKKDTAHKTNANKHTLHLNMTHIQTDMRDVAFYFKKKTLPKLKDTGIADVLLGGEGLSATIDLASTSDPTTLFDIQNISVKVDTLKFAIRDSRHDLLYKTLRPLATNLIKKQVQKAVADGLRTALEWLGEELVAVRDRMNEAKANAGEGEDVGRWQAMQEAFKRRKDETASTTSMSRSGSSVSQFKVVSNKRNSILAGAGHPSGWVNRVDEKEKIATTGENWRSQAFDVQA